MTQTHWTLAQTLQSRGVSPHALAKVSGLSKNTVYDIVNCKSQGVTLETVDRLLSGLEQLTGQRMALDAVLARTMTHDVQDTALLAQLAGLPPFDLEALRASLPHWTPEEQAENERLWLEHESDRRSRGDRRLQRLEVLWEELDGQDTPNAEKQHP